MPGEPQKEAADKKSNLANHKNSMFVPAITTLTAMTMTTWVKKKALRRNSQNAKVDLLAQAGKRRTLRKCSSRIRIRLESAIASTKSLRGNIQKRNRRKSKSELNFIIAVIWIVQLFSDLGKAIIDPHCREWSLDTVLISTLWTRIVYRSLCKHLVARVSCNFLTFLNLISFFHFPLLPRICT